MTNSRRAAAGILATLVAAVALRAWYTMVLWSVGSNPGLGTTWVGPEMRLMAVINTVGIVALVLLAMLMTASLLLRRPRAFAWLAGAMWLACVVLVGVQAMPGARIGLSSMLLLPWVTATTLGLALAVAWELSARLAAATAAAAVLGAAALPLLAAWGAIDFYIAAVVVVTCLLLLNRVPPWHEPPPLRRAAAGGADS